MKEFAMPGFPPSLRHYAFLHFPVAIQPLHDRGYNAIAQNKLHRACDGMCPANPLLESIAMKNRIQNSATFISAGLCLVVSLLADHAGASPDLLT
jgi:hypothetical protein